MSTRRARIKAVASLPVRRKNNETKENANIKTSAPIETSEKPETPKNFTETEINITECLTEPKASLTPKRGLKSTVQTPKTLEKTPRTPKSKRTYTPQRDFSPIVNKLKPEVRPVALVSNVKNQTTGETPINITIRCKPIDNQSPTEVKKVNAPQITKHNLTEKTTEITNRVQKASENILDGISKISDYNPPSVPGSVTEETILDGIVPLESKRNVPKPLELLKNEIISENAEVLFDPIVPLPSPSKVRPKLRPAPRLAFRRNSIQGSASESEDESRRALMNSGASTPAPQRQRHDSHNSHSTQFTVLNSLLRDTGRVRIDSVCSTTSAVANQPPAILPPSASAFKEKQISKSRRHEMSRRMSAMRRKQRRENVARDSLTMYDLIFYNPTTNPIVHEEDPAAGKDKDKSQNKVKDETQSKEISQKPVEAVDDPPETLEPAPVPQIKLGPNGEIILDEKSLVIEQTESSRKLSSSIVHESELVNTGRGRYTRARRTADWSDAETIRFYRALAAVGTDFTMMQTMFPERTRRDLKVKFKKEEKLNGAQLDKALRSQTEWDAIKLESEFAEERRLAAEKKEKERVAYIEAKRLEKARLRAAKNDGFRPSRGSRAIESAVPLGVCGSIPSSEANTADDLIRRAKHTRTQHKRHITDALRTARPIPKLNPIKPKSPISITLYNKDKTPSQEPSPPTLPNTQNIEQGSLVVLTVNDPKEPKKKMLQTYISSGAGRLTPVALPSTLLNSVVSYMKKGTPKSTATSSPQLTSPSSVASQDSRSSVNPSPTKRKRFDSYTITQL